MRPQGGDYRQTGQSRSFSYLFIYLFILSAIRQMIPIIRKKKKSDQILSQADNQSTQSVGPADRCLQHG